MIQIENFIENFYENNSIFNQLNPWEITNQLEKILVDMMKNLSEDLITFKIKLKKRAKKFTNQILKKWINIGRKAKGNFSFPFPRYRIFRKRQLIPMLCILVRHSMFLAEK